MSSDQDKAARLAAKWALQRAETILGHMAAEYTTGWRSVITRWKISAEPLRNDARNALPEIYHAIAKLEETESDEARG